MQWQRNPVGGGTVIQRGMRPLVALVAKRVAGILLETEQKQVAPEVTVAGILLETARKQVKQEKSADNALAAYQLSYKSHKQRTT